MVPDRAAAHGVQREGGGRHAELLQRPEVGGEACHGEGLVGYRGPVRGAPRDVQRVEGRGAAHGLHAVRSRGGVPRTHRRAEARGRGAPGERLEGVRVGVWVLDQQDDAVRQDAAAAHNPRERRALARGPALVPEDPQRAPPGVREAVLPVHNDGPREVGAGRQV